MENQDNKHLGSRTVTKERLLERITVDTAIMTGKPVIKGTRITVDLVLKLLAQDQSIESILEDYPHLKRDDILAALMYGSSENDT